MQTIQAPLRLLSAPSGTGTRRAPSDPELSEAVDTEDPITISCDDCRMYGSDACDDCVVTFICDREPDAAVVIDAAEARAVRLLGRSGLVPLLRHRPRAG